MYQKKVATYAFEITKKFQQEYPIWVSLMKNCNHNSFECDTISQWHPEGDVWTHTMMVVSQMRDILFTEQDYPYYKILLLAALLHDIGKPESRVVREDKQKAVFYGHAGVSTFRAAEVIDGIDGDITVDEKVLILRLINYHQLLYQLDDTSTTKTVRKVADKIQEAELYYMLNILRAADSKGTLAAVQDNINKDHVKEVFNFLKEDASTIMLDKAKPTVTLMVGLPGSGKDHFIENVLETKNVISRDDIIMEISPKGLDYSEAFSEVNQKEVDTIFEQRFNDKIKEQADFVINRTNLTHKGRMKFINRLKDKFNIKIIVLFPDPDDHIARLSSREDKFIPTAVIENMMKTFDMPFANEEAQVLYIFNY